MIPKEELAAIKAFFVGGEDLVAIDHVDRLVAEVERLRGLLRESLESLDAWRPKFVTSHTDDIYQRIREEFESTLTEIKDEM